MYFLKKKIEIHKESALLYKRIRRVEKRLVKVKAQEEALQREWDGYASAYLYLQQKQAGQHANAAV